MVFLCLLNKRKNNMSCADIESLGNKSSTTVSVESLEPFKDKTCDDELLHKFVPEFVDSVLAASITTKEQIDTICNKIKRKHRIPCIPKHDIRVYYETHLKHIAMPKMFHKWMIRRSSRADSGVLVVTITLSPDEFSCNYDCFYCPQETDLKGVHTQPRSYVSSEPAMLRAIGTRLSADSYEFDVKGQFQNRIQAYKFNGSLKTGSSKPKIEVILSGGTWHSYPKEYRKQVATEVYWAANTMNGARPIKSLEEEILENETAEYLIVGLTAETRPDQINPESIIEMLEQGFTRIQLGEQTDNDAILKKVNRKCYVADSIRAHRLLKQAAFKLVVHLMPDLPGSSPEEDKRMLRRYASDPDLRYDDLKIYPTAVIKSSDPERLVTSKIGTWYEKGLWTPYAEKDPSLLVDVLADFKSRVNPWERLQRVIRDFPSKSIEVGYKKITNLRQVIHKTMKERGLVCNCIFCKEIGDMELEDHTPILVVRKYAASGGDEYHLSMEYHEMDAWQQLSYRADRVMNALQWCFTGKWNAWSGCLKSYKGLYGFCRLRIDPAPGGDYLPVLHGCGLIREVHVYGFALGVGNEAMGSQHRGYGKYLVAQAEQISAMNGLQKTAVIAGVGTREYYKNKCGYHKEGTFMKKSLTPYNFYSVERAAVVGILIGALAWLFS